MDPIRNSIGKKLKTNNRKQLVDSGTINNG